jgi:hypothetical protein
MHVDDFAAMIAAALADDRYRGPVNAVAPEQTTNRELTAALGRALRRPAVVPVPEFALRALFGEAAVVLLASQRAEPRALGALGFPFAFPRLDAALASIIRR